MSDCLDLVPIVAFNGMIKKIGNSNIYFLEFRGRHICVDAMHVSILMHYLAYKM